MRTLTLATTTAIFLLVVSVAWALSPEQETYKAAVEPICKKNTLENERLLKNLHKEVKAEKLSQAGGKLLQASTALKKTYGQLKAVPQPSSDMTKLGKWLGYVKKESELFGKAGKALKSGNKGKAQGYNNQLNHNATLANNEVIGYSFKYCKFEASKFT